MFTYRIIPKLFYSVVILLLLLPAVALIHAQSTEQHETFDTSDLLGWDVSASLCTHKSTPMIHKEWLRGDRKNVV